MNDEIKLKDMTDFLENVYKDIKKQPTLEEELEKERKFINKIKGDNKDEIKEFNEEKYVEMLENGELYDYITNLQQENEELNDSVTWWNNRFNAVQRDYEELKWDKEQLNSLVNSCQEEIRKLKEENERLKQELNCKEYFSSTMPENTEFVILTKNNYDRQQKDIQLELIDYKSRIEKAVEYIKECQLGIDSMDRPVMLANEDEGEILLNILNGRSDE